MKTALLNGKWTKYEDDGKPELSQTNFLLNLFRQMYSKTSNAQKERATY